MTINAWANPRKRRGLNSPIRICFSIAMLLSGLLEAQEQEDDDPQRLAARLPIATQNERLGLLTKLTTAHRDKDPAKAIAFGTEALELLRSIPDEGRELEIQNSLASAHILQREWQAALRHGLRAEGLARGMDDEPALALALRIVGEAYRVLNDYERSFDYFAEAIRLYEDLGDSAGLGRTLYLAGISYRLISDYSKALEYQFRAHQASEQAGSRSGMAAALNDIAITYGELGQNSKALEFYQQVLLILEEDGDEMSVARIQNNIGNFYRQQGEPAQALEYFRRSLKIKEKLDDKYGIANTIGNIGQTHQDVGELEQALEFYDRSLEMMEADGYRKGVVGTLLRIASVHRQRGNPAPTIATLKAALALASENNIRGDIQHSYRELSEVYSEVGRFEEALAAFRQYEAIKSEIFNEQNSRAIAEMQARFEADEKQKEIELLEQEQVLTGLELERQRDARRTLVAGFGFVLFSLGLVFYRFRLKAREALMIEAVEQERAVSARLRKIDQLKDEFLANTSHELRTPLYGITGLAESLVDGVTGDLPTATKANLAMIVASGRRLAALVNDILDFSKLRHRNLELDRRPVDLRSLTGVVLTLLRPLVGSKDLELRNTVPADLPAADADENRLQQILLNLVGNAVKFTDSGTVEISAVVGRDDRVAAECLMVSVSDTGIGIPEEETARVFEAFEQADASTERRFGGTGLGLAVARQLVELHGGRIWLESTPREGSTFFFSLPLATAGAVDIPKRQRIATLPAISAAAGDGTLGAAGGRGWGTRGAVPWRPNPGGRRRAGQPPGIEELPHPPWLRADPGLERLGSTLSAERGDVRSRAAGHHDAEGVRLRRVPHAPREPSTRAVAGDLPDSEEPGLGRGSRSVAGERTTT